MEDTARKALVVARIDEAACIGCTLCIAACPVDAIVGAAQLMHTVLADRCTGCELCLPPCPVDCIALLPAGRRGPRAAAALGRPRAPERAARRRRGAVGREARAGTMDPSSAEHTARAQRQAAIASALARARARRAARS